MAEYSNQEIIFIGEKSSTDTHVNAYLDVSRLDSKWIACSAWLDLDGVTSAPIANLESSFSAPISHLSSS